MEAITQGASNPLEIVAIVSYAVVALAAVAVFAGWVEQKGSEPETGYRDSGDEQPEPPEPPTTPSHGPQPDIEPDEIQGVPFLRTLPLWAADKDVQYRAEQSRFRQRVNADMRRVA